MKHAFQQMTSIITLGILVLLLATSTTTLQAGSASEQYRFNRQLIYALKEQVQEDSFRFSRDGSKFAFVLKDRDKYRVMWNNAPGEAFDRIGDIEMSPTGLHLMYWGFRGSSVFLLRDHKVIGSWPAKSGDDLDRYWSTIGPNDHHWVAAGFSEGALNWRLVDGKEQPKLVAHGQVLFSKNGRSWGYIGLNKEGVLVFIVNGKEIRSIPDGNGMMLTASLVNMIIDDEGNIVAAVEPTVGGYQLRYRKDVIATFGTSLSAQGNTLMTVVGIQPKEKEEKAPLIISERFISSKSLQYNSGHIAWVQGKSIVYMLYEVILDGKAIGPKIYAGDSMWLNNVVPQFSPNGDAIAFEGRDETQKWFVWSTKRLSSGYLFTIKPQWSLNGEHIAFTAMEERDGKKEWFYVLDNARLTAYENVHSGRFSADGSVFCYIAKKGEKSVLVINKSEYDVFDKVVAVVLPVERSDALLWYVIKEGGKLYRLELVKTKQ